MNKPTMYRWARSPEPLLEGMYVPRDIDGVRTVANWVHQRRDEGWEVPFLTADGLLIRYPGDSDSKRYHVWIQADSTLLWTGEEFADVWGYEPLPVEGESK